MPVHLILLCHLSSLYSTNVVLILCTVAPMVMLDDVTVNETESADLTCTVTGTPRPNITWYMLTDSSNGTVEVIKNTRYDIMEAVSTGGDKNMQVVSVLTISNTTMDDTGVYTCNATNVQGSDVDSGRLDVQCEYCLPSHVYKQIISSLVSRF